jgi:negative regulator of replication initiation
MADIEFKLKFDDNELLQGMQRVKTSNAEIKQGIDQIVDANREMGTEASRASQQAEDGFSEMNDEVIRVNTSLKNFVDNINIGGVSIGKIRQNIVNFGKSLGDVGRSMLNFVKGTKSASTALKAVTVATKLFRVALISTGIGAIVVALGSLIAYFTRTQKGIDAVNKVLAGLKAAFDVIIDRFSQFGGAIIKLFQGDFKGAAKEAKAAFSGIGDQIISTMKAASELEARIQSLRDVSREWSVEEAKLRAEVADLYDDVSNQLLTYEQRVTAGKKALEKSAVLEQKNIELAEERLDILRKQVNLSESLDDALDAVAEAEIAVFNARRESIVSQKRLNQQMRALEMERRKALEEEEKKVKELEKAYQELINKFNQQVQKAELKLLSPTKRLQAEFLNDIQEIEIELNIIKEVARQLGEDVPDSIIQGFQTRKTAAQEEYKKAIADLVVPTGTIQTTLESAGKANADAIVDNFKKRLIEQKRQTDKLGEDYYKNTIQKLEASFIDGFKKIFNLEDSEEIEAGLSYLKAAGTEVFGSLVDIAAANFQRALQRIDAQINTSKENIQTLNSQLEEERRKQEQGYANDVGLLQKKLEDEQRVLVKAENDKIALQKKQARQQLVIDSALQASQITLGIAKLISSEASKGLIGIFTASSGIALLFSILAKAKSQAASLQDIPKFREGTEYLTGKSHEQGGVLIEAEGGERILSKKLNSKIKMSNEQLVNYALIGEKMIKGFGALANDRKADLFRYEQSNALYTANMIKESIYGAMNENSDRMIDYWKTRPVVIPTPTGTIAESYEGSTKVRKKYRMI